MQEKGEGEMSVDRERPPDGGESEWEKYVRLVDKEDHKAGLRADKFHKDKAKRRAKRKRTGR